MSVKYQLDIEEKFLRIAMRGTHSCLEEMVKSARYILDMALTHQQNRILLDRTQLEDTNDYYDKFLVAERLDKAHVQRHGIKISSLIHCKNQSKERTLETLARNRAISYRTFLTEQEALGWLLGTPEPA